MYELKFTKQTKKDLEKIKKSNLLEKLVNLLQIIQKNPWELYPPYEKLTYELENLYSRRINIQHRLVYEVIKEAKTVKILRMWSHYGDN